MKYNPLIELKKYGQSLWLDYLRRDMLESGELKRLIEDDGLRGMTSNPKIFWNAIDGSDDYSSAIRTLTQQGKTKEEIYRILTVEDVQNAADVFRPLFDELDGGDGFVSLEVNPHLARDVDGTIAEAKELWKALSRPNVFIKVPATKEGLTCIRQLTAAGINVNVTLLFGLDRYRKVAEAYVSGLEDRLQNGESIANIHSVASFFLSRIDVKVDPALEYLQQRGGDKGQAANEFHGAVAVSSARLAYQFYKEMFSSDRFRQLADKGARPQRVLWASTSTKNPDYSDIKYVEALIGPATINTVPRDTLDAYRDHGNPSPRLEDDVAFSKSVLNRLADLGIDLHQITDELIQEGIKKFNKRYDQTLESLEKRMQETIDTRVDSQEMLLGEYTAAVSSRIEQLADAEFCRRLWAGDASLWADNDADREQIRQSLGWLHVAAKMSTNAPELRRFAAEVREAGFRHVVHLGMGGSSLAPLVFDRTLAKGTLGLPLGVLDSTDPQAVSTIEEQIPIEDTLFIVASKSGTTTETVTFMNYFYNRVKAAKGDRAGENFVVITDPGSPLVDTASSRGFRELFVNYADIGGRYSALSYFGMVPAVLMDIDIELLLERAVRMAHANQCLRPGARNAAIELGAALGELAGRGRDKLTFLTSKPVADLGLWLEQLVAESTGKDDRGILPIASEEAGPPPVYGDDRVFIYFELQDEKHDDELASVKKLARAGHPVIIIRLEDRYDLGQEILRWEIATAVAGAVLHINSFDQPNVQASKDNTKRLLDVFRREGALPDAVPGGNRQAVTARVSDNNLRDKLEQIMASVRPGDYIAVQAYMAETAETNRVLQEMRTHLRDNMHVATTLGYGPRFLHSTGQYHKGGPNTGVFLQLSGEPENDLDIPDEDYSYRVLIKAEAQGDFEALAKRDRRILSIALGADIKNGLEQLRETVLSLSHEATHETVE